MSSTNNVNRSIDLLAANINPVKRLMNTLHRIRSKKSTEETNFSATFTALPENEKAQFLGQIFEMPKNTFKDHCKVNSKSIFSTVAELL
jgi:hypothetical protein